MKKILLAFFFFYLLCFSLHAQGNSIIIDSVYITDSMGIPFSGSIPLGKNIRYRVSYQNTGTANFQGSIQLGIQYPNNTTDTLVNNSIISISPQQTLDSLVYDDFTTPARYGGGGGVVVIVVWPIASVNTIKQPFDVSVNILTGIFDEASRLGLFLYPNPTQDQVFIPHGFSYSNAIEQVRLWDVHGRHIRDFRDFPISLSDVPRGIYQVEIRTQQQKVYYIRLLKE